MNLKRLLANIIPGPIGRRLWINNLNKDELDELLLIITGHQKTREMPTTLPQTEYPTYLFKKPPSIHPDVPWLILVGVRKASRSDYGEGESIFGLEGQPPVSGFVLSYDKTADFVEAIYKNRSGTEDKSLLLEPFKEFTPEELAVQRTPHVVRVDDKGNVVNNE